MGFNLDDYNSGGNFVGADEKKVIAESGIPFMITKVRQVHKFEKENFELTVILPDSDDERTLSFPIGTGVESRDAALAGLKAHLESGADPNPYPAKLDKVGKAFIVRSA